MAAVGGAHLAVGRGPRDGPPRGQGVRIPGGQRRRSAQIGTPFKIRSPFAWSRGGGRACPRPRTTPSWLGRWALAHAAVCVQAPSATTRRSWRCWWARGTSATSAAARPARLAGRGRGGPAGDAATATRAPRDAAARGRPRRGRDATPRRARRRRTKINERLYAQPSPPDVRHEEQGVSPSTFGAFHMVVVGVRRATTRRERGSRTARATGWRAWPARWGCTCCSANTRSGRCAWRRLRARAPATHCWRSSTEATGIGHVLSNKGGVGVSCASGHVAASQPYPPGTTTWSAGATTTLPRLSGCSFGEQVECVQAFHHLFWFGDLNYRCEWACPKRRPAPSAWTATRRRSACAG